MKKILAFIFLLPMICSQVAIAQLEGKRFISGAAGLSFANRTPDEGNTTNGYGYGIELNLGKFKTNTLARGLTLKSTLSGGKQSLFINNEEVIVDGLDGFSAGAGYFWQFYKNFNTKFGVFGGPDISLTYEMANTYTSDQNRLNETKAHSGLLGLTISGGAYYALNERWWLLGTVGFANIFNAKYGVSDYYIDGSESQQTTKNFQYGFKPYVNFPSVSLGLRYFLRN